MRLPRLSSAVLLAVSYNGSGTRSDDPVDAACLHVVPALIVCDHRGEMKDEGRDR